MPAEIKGSISQEALDGVIAEGRMLGKQVTANMAALRERGLVDMGFDLLAPADDRTVFGVATVINNGMRLALAGKGRPLTLDI